MADRKITELSLADSTDITSSNAVLHLVNPDRALAADKNRKLELKNNVVLTSQDQTIDGTKTFSNTIVGDISGNADTVDSLHAASFLRSDAADTWTGVLSWGGGAVTAMDLNNGDIVGVNQLLINDPGEGIVWKGGASGDVSLTLVDDATDAWLRIQNAYGRIDFGPVNSSWAHIYTDRPGVYFDKQVNAAELRSRGTATIDGDLYGRSVNAQYSRLYRWGGIYFTWDSDSYGTNFEHSITSTYDGTWGDHITINSYGNVRVNIDSNGNGTNTFTIGRHTTGTANTLFTLDESGNATFVGSLYIPYRLYHSGDTDTYFEFLDNEINLYAGGQWIEYRPTGFQIRMNNLTYKVLYTGSQAYWYSTTTSADTSTYRFHSNTGSTSDLQAAIYGDGDVRNDTGVFASFSDERLKQDITDANSQWEDMKKLRFVNYRLKKRVAFMGDDAPVHLGVISQEVEAAGMGGLVKTTEPHPDDEDQTEYKMFKYSIMHTKAAKALQEAIFRIEALEAEVAALKA